MINWIELVVFVFLIILFFALAYDSLRLRFKVQKLAKQIVQQLLDYDAVVAKFQEAIKENDKKNLEGTEGFVKFLAESRDWAFKYIEDVQGSIDKLKDESAKVNLNSSYLVPEELEGLRKAVAEILQQIPEKSQND
jgi:hypothetical protein